MGGTLSVPGHWPGYREHAPGDREHTAVRVLELALSVLGPSLAQMIALVDITCSR
jgi:hypothetical protein